VEQATTQWGILRSVRDYSRRVPLPSLELGGVLLIERFGDADVHEMDSVEGIIDQSPEQENEDFRNNESPLEENPLEPTLSRYADFFALFGDFRGYVTFFLLQDLVTDEFRVKFFMPFDDFRPPSAPKDIGTDKEYRRRSIEFIEARNHRIQRLDTA